MRFYDRIAILRVEADIDVKLQLERCKIAYGVFIRGIESFKNQEINGIDHTYLDAIHSIFCQLYNFIFPLPTLGLGWPMLWRITLIYKHNEGLHK